LNVPDVEASELQGVRAARLGRGGTIRSVTYDRTDTDAADNALNDSRDRVVRHLHIDMPPGPRGTMRLDLAVPGSAGQEAPGEHDTTDVDALLIGHNFATLTALVGVHEATDSVEMVSRGIEVLQNRNKSADSAK
jgi:hypothetical protein